MLLGVGVGVTSSVHIINVAKNSKMTMNKSHIVAFGEPEDDIKNAYNSKFGGIVVASNNLQIPE